uniref:RNA-directed DNA polymerase, eukaryota n=1 Tax=Tanacetum cinerariifolium TaxID=118510 RepID=A0A699I9A8_TANCI|nr:RNA-directed DNA polymerase, eukaryota [Tanacetum cinerariifolium]
MEASKQVYVAEKFTVSVTGSFRRDVRGGAEPHQLSLLTNLLDTVTLSNMKDRWFFDLNGDGRFCVKDVRCLLDDVFLPKAEVPTRWIKSIPIKINIFAWKLCLDRLPTRVNLAKRNVAVASLLCPLCDTGMEDAAHLFFRCDMAKDVMFLVSRWWDLEDRSMEDAAHLFFRCDMAKDVMFLVSRWWDLEDRRNLLLFEVKKPRKDVIFDDIVLRSFNWCVARGFKTLNCDSWL